MMMCFEFNQSLEWKLFYSYFSQTMWIRKKKSKLLIGYTGHQCIFTHILIVKPRHNFTIARHEGWHLFN